MDAPAAKITIQTMDGKDHELKMTFNHLSLITARFAGVEQAAMAGSIPEARDHILAVMFGVRENGKFRLAETDVIDLDPDEAGKLFDWVTEHLTHFFVRRLAKAREQLGHMIPEIKAMNPTSLKRGSES